MKEFIQKYPRLAAGTWFVGLGTFAYILVWNLFGASKLSIQETWPAIVPSFLPGFFLGLPLLKTKMTGWHAGLLGALIGVVATYLCLIEFTVLEHRQYGLIGFIQECWLAFLALLVMCMSGIGILPVILTGGLGGWSLHWLAQRMDICPK